MIAKSRYFIAVFAIIFLLSACSANKKEYSGLTSEQVKIAEMIIDAATQIEIGNLEQAEKIYEEILSVNADNSLAYNQKAISLDKKNHWYREQLAEIYMQTNRLPKAIEQYEILIKQNTEIEAYYQQIALMYYQNDELDKVIGIINRMEKQFGFNENMGKAKYGIYNAMNQKDKAEKEIKNLIFKTETKEEITEILDNYLKKLYNEEKN